MVSKYSRVLSDIGLTEFEILSDWTKYCQTELFFIKHKMLAKHDRGMDGRTDRRWTKWSLLKWHTITTMTYYFWSGSILFDKVVCHATQRVHVWCHLTIFKCQWRLAWFLNVLEWPLCVVCSVFILLCFEFVPPPNLLFFYVCFCFAKATAIFLQIMSYRARYIFWGGGRKFLSVIWSCRLAFFVGHFEKNVRLSNKFRQHW